MPLLTSYRISILLILILTPLRPGIWTRPQESAYAKKEQAHAEQEAPVIAWPKQE